VDTGRHGGRCGSHALHTNGNGLAELRQQHDRRLLVISAHDPLGLQHAATERNLPADA
jgi:hypothetical protein